ncbi:MAG: type II toxin-antitoxin system VapC family toxin [Deltaproteobacteria bacterium]|nr:type II toxin-antitoxin system VapC family toxin [Deltaproteobacteria bacterium]
MSWLLDTCVLSEYARKVPAPHVIAWLDEQDEESLFMSVISLGEIEKGIIKLTAADPGRSRKLTSWLGMVEQRFSGRILPLDTTALRVWAQIAARAELAGQPLPVMDALLMATAQCHGLTIVTRNEKDFTSYPQIFNPWAL